VGTGCLAGRPTGARFLDLTRRHGGLAKKLVSEQVERTVGWLGWSLLIDGRQRLETGALTLRRRPTCQEAGPEAGWKPRAWLTVTDDWSGLDQAITRRPVSYIACHRAAKRRRTAGKQ